jgi:predicted acylesterase/phospholipase RssA/CRP-like cAMP-binding protein
MMVPKTNPALIEALQRYFGTLDAVSLDSLMTNLHRRELASGQTLIRQGDPAEAMYLLVSGRLTVYREKAGEPDRVLGSVFRGESVGEMGLLNGGVRNATVKASRDSVLAEITRDEFERLTNAHPALLRAFTCTIVERLSKSNDRSPRQLRPSVALVPLHEIGDYQALTHLLVASVGQIAPSQFISQEAVAQALGLASGSLYQSAQESAINHYLAEADSHEAHLIYQADPTLSPWTRKCVRQADVVYLLAEAGQSDLEEELLEFLQNRRQRHPEVAYHLLLLHPEDATTPTGTRSWLDRLQPNRHHHLRRGRHQDFSRLARSLTGQSIGLALGGGGAKGMAHLGVFRALQEAAIPVDLISGTSIGAIMGATLALGWSLDQIADIGKQVFLQQNISGDYQLPFYSLIRGERKEAVLRELFDYQIEDLWYDFRCVSCDLSTNQMHLHDRGSLWKALMASSALPGVFPPFIDEGRFLVDGALINNLPGDLLLEAGAQHLISVDVNNAREIYPGEAEFPTGSTVLRYRLLGRRRQLPRMPSIGQTFMRSTYLASTQHTRQVMGMAALPLQPPVKQIGLLAWNKMDQAVEAGYQHTRQYLKEHGNPFESLLSPSTNQSL